VLNPSLTSWVRPAAAKILAGPVGAAASKQPVESTMEQKTTDTIETVRNHNVDIDQKTIALIETAAKHNPEVARLYNVHKELKRLAGELNNQSHLTAEEQIVLGRLKIERLRLRGLFGWIVQRRQSPPTRMIESATLEAPSLSDIPLDTSAPSIEEKLAVLAADVPNEEWDKLPKDLSANIDHYLYGTPKR
jgi:hypothetical protein